MILFHSEALQELLVENGPLVSDQPWWQNNRFYWRSLPQALYATGEFVRPRTNLELREY